MDKELNENMYLANNIKIKRIMIYILVFIDIVVCFSSLLLLPATLTDFSAAAFGFFLFMFIAFGILVCLRCKSLLYLEQAIYYSKFFLNQNEPFIDITTLPKFKDIGFTVFVTKKYKSNILKCVDGAIKKGYLINCTIEIHNGIPKIALAKKIVKDKCPNCGASIVGAINDTYVCKYCGNKIFNVIEKK